MYRLLFVDLVYADAATAFLSRRLDSTAANRKKICNEPNRSSAEILQLLCSSVQTQFDDIFARTCSQSNTRFLLARRILAFFKPLNMQRCFEPVPTKPGLRVHHQSFDQFELRQYLTWPDSRYLISKSLASEFITIRNSINRQTVNQFSCRKSLDVYVEVRCFNSSYLKMKMFSLRVSASKKSTKTDSNSEKP
jgi:hypothetical protein